MAAETETETETETNSEQKTITQLAERLSFFFSNANLRMDKFMRKEILEVNKQTNGYVPISVLLRFNTIQKITTDPKIIASAVASVSKPKLQLNDDQSSIGRVEPFSLDMMNDNVKLSLRVSNIPTKGEEGHQTYTVTREEVAQVFQAYGDVALVRLITNTTRGPNNRYAVGRGFVEFHSIEDMEKATADLCVADITNEELKPNNILSIAGSELKCKTMQQWLDKRAIKDEARGKTPRSDHSRNEERKNKEQAKLKRAREEEEEQAKNKAELDAIEFKLDWKPKCVVSIKGMPDGCDREKILEAVKTFVGDDDICVRVDYSRGQKDGAIRFDEPIDKIGALATGLNGGEITIDGTKVESAALLEGDEENTYYKNYIEFRTKQLRTRAEEKQQRKRFKGNNHRGGGGGGGYKGGNKGGYKKRRN